MKRSPFVSVGAWVLVASVYAAGGDSRAAAPAKTDEHARPAPGDYPLTPKNGPWMIMVKSFKGPQAIEIANQLATELRD